MSETIDDELEAILPGACVESRRYRDGAAELAKRSRADRAIGFRETSGSTESSVTVRPGWGAEDFKMLYKGCTVEEWVLPDPSGYDRYEPFI